MPGSGRFRDPPCSSPRSVIRSCNSGSFVCCSCRIVILSCNCSSFLRMSSLKTHCQCCRSVCYLLCKQSCTDDSESEREYRAHRVGRLHRQSTGRLHSCQTIDSVCRSVRVCRSVSFPQNQPIDCNPDYLTVFVGVSAPDIPAQC